MKAISLFAGVGGFDLALTRNGASLIPAQLFRLLRRSWNDTR